MASDQIEAVGGRLAKALGDKGEAIVPQVVAALQVVEAHGDREGFSGMLRRVAEVCEAIETKDAKKVEALAAEYGPLAVAFGVELLKGKE